MGRRELHSAGTILDGARTLVLAGGVPAATISAIAEASRAPAGSIYHRFGSRDALLAELWIRAVRRSQAIFTAAIESAGEPPDAIVAGGLSLLDFASREYDDARLVVSFRREDLIRSQLPPDLVETLGELNKPVAREVVRLARDLSGTSTQAAREIVALGLIDIPYGAVRRHLVAGRLPPAKLRPNLERAIRAVLAGAQNDRRSRRS